MRKAQSLVVFFLAVFVAVDLPARERIALVIGNANYHVMPLDTALNDARNVAKVLRQSVSRVTVKLDADQQTMETAIGKFAQSLHANAEALFYYAGHGAQAKDIERENYLIPIGATPKIQRSAQLRYKAVPASLVLREMEHAGSPLNIIILDACRNSPFRGFRRSLGRGLARMPSVDGALIAYSTAPGAVALDSTGGRNSPYTAQLVKFMRLPGLTLEQVLKNTRREVKSTTNGDQPPWYESSLDGYFYFFQASDNDPVNTYSQISSAAQTQPVQDIFQDRLKNGSLGPKMKVIQAGTFRMGDIQGKGYDSEKPVHSVTLSQFSIGVYEVTFAEYDRFVEAAGRKKPSDSRWGRGDRPVINVSWHDATAYAKWLGGQTGHEYRLPTEAEWEYAARAGSETAYYFGNGASGLGEYAWYQANSGKKMHPVGGKLSNAWGLYDMHGNVWEWVQDWHGDYSSEALTDPSGPGAGSARVLRGGSWGGDADDCRSAYRGYWYGPGNRDGNTGFRLARTYP
ncbi:MAG: SUMF1/EgtB/PvdO family nonheme iron enzyme [Gammaproteobacteria bacterium]|nr:SUMF1/EgtB/PvdO family nonheme iron enzyme [Gammaproteobacteria bacterium]